ncbi:NF-X1-type zinc finger protein NFXL1 [Impatiens glandulifera]|uniref:NF-X1-type zinc finger protein NFXL1 n=1 Tax=Impatiens glandulifera TaxID=253017 RepID=UPI001FB11057|nr:NF-X1-type zinc finger protein NFXL1 [Impatiens glandulifera]XP_047332850.1 NF-X1-type zinc finger protein NFXL1 [Impatiens glandulifera]
MSSHVRSDRRDNHNNNNRARNTGQSAARQEWVPRGTTTAPAPAPPPPATNTTVQFPIPITSNPTGNGSSGGHVVNSDTHFPQQQNRYRVNLGGGHQGRRYNQRKERPHQKVNEQEKVPKDTNLPLLVQEIQEKLTKGAVECMICYDMVGRSAPIWSCQSCYSIFHLTCIKKWARAPTSVDLSAEKNQGFNWRCPGCQSVQFTVSKDIRYYCFCGNRQEPQSDLYLTPHSCGEPCGKPLEKEAHGGEDDHCPHICVIQCHPGPCPPCKAFAPPRPCPCGRKTITTRCFDRKSVLTCGNKCQKLLSCLRHRCESICHVGDCDPCEVGINASCFCNKVTEEILCGDMFLKGELPYESGVFSCNSLCGRKLGCGNHDCDEICHPGSCGTCALLPGNVSACYCGKTALQTSRETCLDPIPTCSETCGRTLICGIHRCEETCHAGECPPCKVMVTQKCRCASTSRITECFRLTSDEKFKCDKPCLHKKGCGRHRCSERCCLLSNPSFTLERDWDPHMCSMPCGKKLRCGQHSCESLCHSGHCPPCLETIFTELTCACGKTVIPPPQPCGTPSPSCQLACSVQQPCGHVSNHSCHFGDCPPCSVPIAKECTGGHVVLRSIPCGSKDIRCNKLCGKTRQCGLHACARSCHPPPCDSSCGPNSNSNVKASCGQTCGAPRRDCRHTCVSLCHPSSACPDARCEFSVPITCVCGRITVSVPCDAGGSNGGYGGDSLYEASITQKLPLPLQPVETNGRRVPLGQRKLACDDECAKLGKKRVLADAFGITPPNLDALHFGDSSGISEAMSDLFRRDPKWVLSVEERCKILVLGRGRGGASGLKVHVFCPMIKEKRDAVRLIAERWKLSINAAGWEPRRFIVVHVTQKSKAPSRILGSKGGPIPTILHAPVFDPLTDMDPRLVVSLFDLPSDADISALVLRFGGECELVWLNDKNALAVFSDPARAATAMRRLDQGSVYHGAIMMVAQNGGGASSTAGAWGGQSKDGLKSGGGLWKKAVVQESGWSSEGGSWNGNGNAEPLAAGVWKGKEESSNSILATSVNRWSVLESSSSSTHVVGKSQVSSDPKPEKNEENEENDISNVVDDWEKAYED